MKLIIDIPDNELKDPLKNIHLLISNGIVTEVCIKKYDKDEPYFMDLNYAPLEECDDCISRREVLERAINAPIAKVVTEDKVIYRKIIFADDVEKLPPVTPQYTDAEIQKMQDLEFAEIQKAYEIGKAENPNKWIPVSVRLPEKTDFYLIQHTRKYCSDEMAVAFYSVQEAHVDPNYTWEFETVADVQEVIAWMPLPEPYKQEVEE